jgi:uncharacterized protein YbcI
MMLKARVETRGQMEATVSDIITRFEKEYMGRGPLETRTYIIDDMIITRLKGILTKAEMKLAQSEDKSRARDLIKQVRIELLESARPILEDLIRRVTRRRVQSLHSDISTASGEKIIIFVLDKPPEFAVPT